jgi:hemerythrin superfamily protein
MAEAIDGVQVLINDHRTVEDLFSQYEKASDPGEQTRIVHQVIHELAVHGEIEELLFYPRLRTALGDGNALADEAIHEHVEIKQTLNALDKMKAGDDGFDTLMKELMAEVRHHVEEEERDIFPAIRAAMPAKQLEQLGRSLQGAKAIVPTRPHPAAPTGPIGKLATSPPVALVDRVRDVVRGWRDEASQD